MLVCVVPKLLYDVLREDLLRPEILRANKFMRNRQPMWQDSESAERRREALNTDTAMEQIGVPVRSSKVLAIANHKAIIFKLHWTHLCLHSEASSWRQIHQIEIIHALTLLARQSWVLGFWHSFSQHYYTDHFEQRRKAWSKHELCTQVVCTRLCKKKNIVVWNNYVACNMKSASVLQLSIFLHT